VPLADVVPAPGFTTGQAAFTALHPQDETAGEGLASCMHGRLFTQQNEMCNFVQCITALNGF